MQKKTNNRVKFWILLVLLFVQALLIFLTNMFRSVEMLDYDPSLAFRHSIEMWKNGLFLNDFSYFSTIEIDNACFFAVPLYFITHNLGLSIAISHLFFYFVIVFLLIDIYKNIGLDLEHALLAIILLFSPYSIIGLNWADMIFLMVGQYEFRIICLLFLIDLYFISKRNSSLKIVFMTLGAALLIFWTSLSCGNYVLLMIVFPFVVFTLIQAVINHKIIIKSRWNFVLIIAIISSFGGWIVRNKLVGASFRNDLNLIPANNFMNNFENMISGIFMLFGGLTEQTDASVMSKDGLYVLMRFGFLILLLCLIVIKIKYKEHRTDMLGICLAVAFVNLGVLITCNTTYGSSVFEFRYHIIWCVTMLLCVAEGIRIFSDEWIDNCVEALVLILVFAINVSGFYKSYVYLGKADLPNKYIAVANQYGAGSIYLYGMDNLYGIDTESHIIRALDQNLYCVSVTYDNGQLMDIGDIYYSYADRASSNEKNILVCSPEEFEELPDYLTSGYSEIEVLEEIGKSIYYSNRNGWDGTAGLPYSNCKESIDFPYTSGYCYEGEIGTDGILHIDEENEGLVLQGPYTTSHKGTYDISLYYDLKMEQNQQAIFSVSMLQDGNETELQSITLSDASDVSTLENVSFPDGAIVMIKVYVQQGTILNIEKIQYIRR